MKLFFFVNIPKSIFLLFPPSPMYSAPLRPVLQFLMQKTITIFVYFGVIRGGSFLLLWSTHVFQMFFFYLVDVKLFCAVSK